MFYSNDIQIRMEFFAFSLSVKTLLVLLGMVLLKLTLSLIPLTKILYLGVPFYLDSQDATVYLTVKRLRNETKIKYKHYNVNRNQETIK